MLKKYKVEHKAEIAEYNKRYKAEHKAEVAAYNKQYNEEHKDVIVGQALQRKKKRFKDDEQFKLAIMHRKRLWRFLKRNCCDDDEDKIMKQYSCSCDVFKRWIEHLFSDDMTWSNYGTHWTIDHIRPCSSFDLTDDIQLSRCFAFTNLRPVLRSVNYTKSCQVQDDLVQAYEQRARSFCTNNNVVLPSF